MTASEGLRSTRGERGCRSVSVGGLRCQYPEGQELSHGYRGAEWSVGRDPQAEPRSTPPGLHADAELDRPEHLTDERLVEIVAECLRRWDAFPTIPGSRRWARNGGVALTELASRLRRA